MKSKWFIAAGLTASLFLAACGGSSEENAGADGGEGGGGAGDAKKGQELFNATCASCHGKDALNPSTGKDMVASAWIKGQSDADLLAMIKKGRATSDPENTTGVDMPAKGGNPSLTDDDLNNIIAYIRTINKGA
jgi:disulfide bond formation protein DsbB